MKVWISWIKYISFVFYGYGLLQHIEFAGRQLYACSIPETGGVSKLPFTTSHLLIGSVCSLSVSACCGMPAQQMH